MTNGAKELECKCFRQISFPKQYESKLLQGNRLRLWHLGHNRSADFK
jgi:hypothetical protein